MWQTAKVIVNGTRMYHPGLSSVTPAGFAGKQTAPVYNVISTISSCNQHLFATQSAPDYERPHKRLEKSGLRGDDAAGKSRHGILPRNRRKQPIEGVFLYILKKTSLWRCRETMRFIVSTRGHDKRTTCHVFDDKKCKRKECL